MLLFVDWRFANFWPMSSFTATVTFGIFGSTFSSWMNIFSAKLTLFFVMLATPVWVSSESCGEKRALFVLDICIDYLEMLQSFLTMYKFLSFSGFFLRTFALMYNRRFKFYHGLHLSNRCRPWFYDEFVSDIIHFRIQF